MSPQRTAPPGGHPPLPSRAKGSLWAWALIGVGAVMLTLSGGYLAYGNLADRTLGDLNYSQPAATAEPGASGKTDGTSPSPSPAAGPAPAAFSLYPGPLLAFNTWGDPWTTAPVVDDSASLLRQYLPVSPSLLMPPGSAPTATTISIPSIEVEAVVQDLAVKDLGDSREYQTPDHVVGHIPTTGNPGETSSGWYFGHLESPLRGEGSVFRSLPLLPDMLRQGQRVFVELQSPRGSYLYEVYDTKVIPQDDLRITETAPSDIVLVTCVPAYKYDHRLLVTARLTGFKPAS